MKLAKEYLEYTAKLLVKNDPDAVRVEESSDEMGVLLTLHVDRSDMGIIIGKAGSVVACLRTLVRILGLKENAHVSIRVAEPEGGRVDGI